MAKEAPHIAIVGSGISANTFAEELLERVQKDKSLLPLELDIYEAGAQLQNGIAWDPSGRYFHRETIYFSTDYIKKVAEAIRNDPSLVNGDMRHLDVERHEVSRALSGKMRKRRMERMLENLESAGVKIHRHTNCTIVDVQKQEDGYNLISATGKHYHADYATIATGHWQGQGALNSHPGIYDSPWPASKLEAIDTNQSIAVMGTSLSAVDAMLTLAHQAGHFERDADNKLHFIPNPENPAFALEAYSPHGMLPGGKGKTLGLRNILSSSAIERLKDKDGVILLDAVFAAMSNDFMRYSGVDNSPITAKIRRTLTKQPLKLEDAVNAVYEAYEKTGPTEWLRIQCDLAKESRKNDTTISWQNYLINAMYAIDKAYPYFSAEDKDRFSEYIQPLYMKLAVPMVQGNAEEILALLESDRLHVHRLGKHHSLGTARNGNDKLPGAEIRYTDQQGHEHYAHHAVVIKASGDDARQLRHSSELMKNLFASGIVQSPTSAYHNSSAGAKAHIDELKSGGAQRTFYKDGRYYRDDGGILVDPHRLSVIPTQGPSKKSSRLYVMGPLLAANMPLPHGTISLNDAAHSILDDIQNEILTERWQAHANKPTQEPEALLGFTQVTKPDGSDHMVAIVKERVGLVQTTAIKEYVASHTGYHPKNVEISTYAELEPTVQDLVANMGVFPQAAPGHSY
ncbi:MAG: FAD/NAD(P)-binding protein [Rickettsiales bacterium]|nr:FAD/NAD(P)-binding protein [Rickettsiales bacterium]